MMFMSVVILCIMLGGFMIRSCTGKTNSSSEAKQAISDVKKIIDKKKKEVAVIIIKMNPDTMESNEVFIRKDKMVWCRFSLYNPSAFNLLIYSKSNKNI